MNALKQSKFKVSVHDMMKLIDSYRNRKFDEDIMSLKNDYGGPEGLAEKLVSSTKNGIVPNDLEQRDEVFGTNKKNPPKRTKF